LVSCKTQRKGVPQIVILIWEIKSRHEDAGWRSMVNRKDHGWLLSFAGPAIKTAGP
jgi:hypothetical protein